MTEASPNDSSPIRPGAILAGKYRVERVLGEGGMGVVVAAMHLQLEELVAIKFMLPQHAANKEALERFLREARAASKLKNEHVTRVYDVGVLDSGEPFMVMELLEGCDLSQLLQSRAGAMHVPEAVEYIMQACEALASAHAAGIVHRDLKPQNLFVTRRDDGRPLVKVLDFGISKITGQIGGTGSLTATTAVLGSPNYMSPEQMRSSKDTDARTDIWSLGVCLFELLSGRVPFDGDSVIEIGAKVLHEPVPRPAQFRPGIPPGLEAVILKCLEKNPQARFANVAELVDALQPFAVRVESDTATRARALLMTGSYAQQPQPMLAPAPPVIAQALPKPAHALNTSTAWGNSQPKAGETSVGVKIAAVCAGSAVLAMIVAFVLWAALRPGASSSQSATAAPVQPAVSVSVAPASTEVPASSASAAASATTPVPEGSSPTPPRPATATATAKPPVLLPVPAKPPSGKKLPNSVD